MRYQRLEIRYIPLKLKVGVDFFLPTNIGAKNVDFTKAFSRQPYALAVL